MKKSEITAFIELAYQTHVAKSLSLLDETKAHILNIVMSIREFVDNEAVPNIKYTVEGIDGEVYHKFIGKTNSVVIYHDVINGKVRVSVAVYHGGEIGVLKVLRNSYDYTIAKQDDLNLEFSKWLIDNIFSGLRI